MVRKLDAGVAGASYGRMRAVIEELDYRKTDRGELILRRRLLPQDGKTVVYEVILNGEFLMSSLFHVSEDALAILALKRLQGKTGLRIVVGGLGLGYTAVEALRSNEVVEVRVVEVFPEVIAWHQAGVLPVGRALAGDGRCVLQAGDFFALAADAGFDPSKPGRRFDAVLLDIDHTPEHWLHPNHRGFYTEDSLRGMQLHLVEGGVFALWADGRPDEAFTARLERAFGEAQAEVVEFANPLTGGVSAGTIYLAQSW